MKHAAILIGVLIVAISSTGCYSMYYSQYDQEEIQSDSSAISIEDVVKLSNEGVGDDVVISQIRATRSYFELNTDEIVELKKVGIHITTHIIIHTTDTPGILHLILDFIAVDIMDTVHQFLTILLTVGIIAVVIIPDMDTKGIISVVIVPLLVVIAPLEDINEPNLKRSYSLQVQRESV